MTQTHNTHWPKKQELCAKKKQKRREENRHFGWHVYSISIQDELPIHRNASTFLDDHLPF